MRRRGPASRIDTEDDRGRRNVRGRTDAGVRRSYAPQAGTLAREALDDRGLELQAVAAANLLR